MKKMKSKRQRDDDGQGMMAEVENAVSQRREYDAAVSRLSNDCLKTLQKMQDGNALATFGVEHTMRACSFPPESGCIERDVDSQYGLFASLHSGCLMANSTTRVTRCIQILSLSAESYYKAACERRTGGTAVKPPREKSIAFKTPFKTKAGYICHAVLSKTPTSITDIRSELTGSDLRFHRVVEESSQGRIYVFGLVPLFGWTLSTCSVDFFCLADPFEFLPQYVCVTT
jgi:hypothetical protein